ncbi:LytTR family DNA-binding domain-containing protein [Marinimicrobium sp. ABcell2]|uniref:LytR/AlgR family response regulator transcription factor n=1 Tax=Marinimicrobium sp. ABcell2 TaxID=3069751 RepID=UPI0027B5E888|nr:LytTR family transcriptional regulator DNA-binding domain-containing protein [Marinimicrobium sp. ABcell2]MDQ2075930.1 LytTR family transcriptional regulator DNA-binding domain-containing protein [Marinimicrobium sp. ABcell2]
MKALVIEDSRLARNGLLKMLSGFKDLEVVGAAGDAVQARELIDQHRPGLLFLDIHMPGETGFELLETLDYQPRIIFTTAYSEHAIRSFDYRTVDYLLKPISQERLAVAIEKLASEEESDSEQPEPPLELNSRIFVKDGSECHLIEVQSIEHFENCKNYARLFFNGKKAFVKKSLSQLEQRLPSKLFFRANRQFIINLDAITSISEAIHEGYDVTMRNGETIEISRRNAQRLKELMSL